MPHYNHMFEGTADPTAAQCIHCGLLALKENGVLMYRNQPCTTRGDALHDAIYRQVCEEVAYYRILGAWDELWEKMIGRAHLGAEQILQIEVNAQADANKRQSKAASPIKVEHTAQCLKDMPNFLFCTCADVAPDGEHLTPEESQRVRAAMDPYNLPACIDCDLLKRQRDGLHDRIEQALTILDMVGAFPGGLVYTARTILRGSGDP